AVDKMKDKIVPSSRTLATNLERSGVTRPAASAAHHIVAGNAQAAAPARSVLARFEVNINAVENGVFLPLNRGVPNPAGVAVHSTLHSNAYYQTVNNLMTSASTRTEALDVLAYLRQGLLAGDL
ncbi:MAG: AHH domain-containing protein, partial [Actinobacteria bacterium]|nr:AHH domain-containing protein [Actinomycetota bacterium]